ncbi:MAG: (S)-benzoin forming benzil reductase [Bacillota bacterium]
MNYYIVTGASRGLGEAIVKELLVNNNVIFYLSRTRNLPLEELAASKNTSIYFEECDLSEVGQLGVVIKKVFSKIDLQQGKKITLINNAGMIEPIKNVGDADEKDIVSNVQINLLAPMILCEHFINETKAFNDQSVIVNITSGAANRPIAGWSSYCSTKAGLNMFTTTIGAEQVERENKVLAISFSPGIMDTTMQSTIRTAEKDDFPSINQFKEYHENGLLRSPNFVARTLIKLLSSSLENGRIYDIKEFI